HHRDLQSFPTRRSSDLALEKLTGAASFDDVAETIKKTAFQITRMGQLVAREASRRLNIPFGIVDLSLAPTPAAGDSVARILEEIDRKSTRLNSSHVSIS